MSQKRIMIIDDDRTHLLTTQELLEDDGYEVLTHVSGFGATERIMVARPDLVLLDVNMPALSGEALLPILKGRESIKATPVVLHSSNDESTLRTTATRLGAAGYVCKGDVTGLRRTVARLTAATAAAEPR
jgi:CheY-like chemotaxis protein